MRTLFFGLGAFSLLLGGCITIENSPTIGDTTQTVPGRKADDCRALYVQLAQVVKKAGVKDAQTATLADFPYLRTNRFWSSFREQSLEENAFQFWVDQLRQLGQQGWQVETANLPSTHRQALAKNLPKNLSLGLYPFDTSRWQATLEKCGKTLQKQDLVTGSTRQRLRNQAITPESYSEITRIVGLYPLTKHAMHWANQRSRDVFNRAYLTHLEALPIQGKLIRFVPPNAPPSSSKEVAALLKLSSYNPMSLPIPKGFERDRLFDIFAPILEVDVAHRDDWIGTPVWPPTSKYPEVDANQPVLYRYISHTRFQGRILLQLNYSAWFPARTLHGVLDMEGGRFSGIIWRITLTPEGRALLYDSSHSCACYHMFYPSESLQAKIPQDVHDSAEAPFKPQVDTYFPDSGHLVLRIAHLTHHLYRVYPFTKEKSKTRKVTYVYGDYSQLRSLPYGLDTYRSLFDQDGMVHGSERLVGRIFWPMGVHIIGSMRQRGNHATAFTGKRHFDEPYLLDRFYIERALEKEEENEDDDYLFPLPGQPQ